MMTARDYLRVLREGWIIVVICTLLGTAVGAVVAFTRTPMYEATSTLAVSTCVAVENSSVCDPVGGISFAIQRARIYASTVDNLPVQRRALELTDATDDRRELRASISVTQLPDSPIINVTARWPIATEAADLSNAVAQALVEYAGASIDNFESDLATVQFSVVSEASPPGFPMRSQSSLLPAAAVLGLLAGLTLALARYLLNGRVRYVDEVERRTGLVVIGEASTRDLDLDSAKLQFLTTMLLSRAHRAPANRIAIAVPNDSAIFHRLATVLADASAVYRPEVVGSAAEDHHEPGLREATTRILEDAADLTRAEGVSIAASVDAIVITVHLGVTTRQQLDDAIRAASLIETPILGIVAIGR